MSEMNVPEKLPDPRDAVVKAAREASYILGKMVLFDERRNARDVLDKALAALLPEKEEVRFERLTESGRKKPDDNDGRLAILLLNRSIQVGVKVEGRPDDVEAYARLFAASPMAVELAEKVVQYMGNVDVGVGGEISALARQFLAAVRGVKP